ncbi:MAG: cyclic nucleotide-binding domain-containing protein [Cyanobacteria bacterium P01_F01_bin.53]
MSDILLRELDNAEIDWLVTTGERLPLKVADALIQPGQALDFLYLLLEGELMARSLTNEVIQLTRGALIGEEWLFDSKPVVAVTATSPAMVLAIPRADLTTKLRQDASFSAHFYKALALTLSERIRNLFEKSELLRYRSGQMVKEALLVFGELHDSDIDWMMCTGQLEKLSADRVLLNAGRPVDALYTVLDGQLAIATTENPCDPLSTCSHGLEELGATQNFNPIAYISRGSLPGIISFLDFQPLPVRIHAVKEALLLAIPRRQVVIKLQEDLSFAARFYKVIATQMASLLSTVVSLDGEGSSMGAAKVSDFDNTLGEGGMEEDELDLAALQRVSQGASKFDWMLKQLGVGCR